jgi:acyl-CoA reductase-like NAD-dependent aldehyde dehydrogenase
MSDLVDDVLILYDPATGSETHRVVTTTPERVSEIVAHARNVQEEWGARPWIERKQVLSRWWRILSRDTQVWVDLIREEIGKPRPETLAGDVVSTLDAIRWTVKKSGKVLAEGRFAPGWQKWLLMPTGRLKWNPVGVVGMIGTWNYPLFLNAPPIAQAIAAGNAVVWKPSELAIRTGQRIQESIEAAGIPKGLVQAVYGGPKVGAALAESGIDKGFFTGGINSGRQVLAALGAQGIPAIAELSGFDPAIILPDAPQRSTVEALTWAAFVGCGQTCVAVKRVYTVGDARPWAEAFATRAKQLKIGNPAETDTDVGPMITPSSRDRFDWQVKAAVQVGARVLSGGMPVSGPGWFYAPTVLLAETADPETVLAGAFGPLIVIRGVKDTDEAVAAANSSSFALGASVWGKNRRAAQRIARRLQAGMVSVNDAVIPTAHAAAPFGGCKASGYGRTHGAMGLLEFTQAQVLFDRPAGGLRPQLFPYARAEVVERALRWYCRAFHPGG